MVPLYAARIEDLGSGDFVKVTIQRSAAFFVAQRFGNSRLISLVANGNASHPLASHSASASLRRRSPMSCFQVTSSSIGRSSGMLRCAMQLSRACFLLGSRCKRSAGVEITRTSEPNGRNRNGQSARLDTNFRSQIMARWARRCSRPRDDGRVFDFSMGSTFRAIGQSPTRNALVSEIRRDCTRRCTPDATGPEMT